MFLPTPELFDLKRSRVLLVDDEPANLKLFGLMLRASGYTSVTAIQDPREVVAAYQAAKPDLLLLDINMPHMSGLEVMAALAALDDPLPAPVVVLTAQSGEDLLLKALEAGAADFLTKPVNRRELLARVHNILLAQVSRRLLHDQAALLETMVRQRTQELEQSRLDIVRKLGRAAEYRDNETGDHVLRMSHACALLAKKIGWAPAACELILHASAMHDVGKIGIPDGILLKPDTLTPGEREIMKTHAAIGARILEGEGPLLGMAREIALCHHEKWDGTGYPNGLAGEAIPEAARIVAIADVFDALTSTRPYKKPWSIADALAYMNDQAGKHFDADLLSHFVEILDDVIALRARFASPEATLHTLATDR